MEPKLEAEFRSGISGAKNGEMAYGIDETSSFTALLELPPPQAVELLVNDDFPVKTLPPPIFPSNFALIDRASKFSVFASADNKINNAILKIDAVKQEPLDSDKDSLPNSSSPAISNQSNKRKDREKKIKEPSKKNKKAVEKNVAGDEEEKLPYVHVRARRGQATDSHSLAERARREKINARMKLLQELVPGCNKISGTAMVLDEIINHVQALQRQVEFLSMRLAAVNPRTDFNFDALLAAESGSLVDNSYTGMLAPPVWPEGQVDGMRQQLYQQQWHFDGVHQPVWTREEDNSQFITPDNSLLSYDSPANSASLPSSQPKMEP